jgi:hypothetical protein
MNCDSLDKDEQCYQQKLLNIEPPDMRTNERN